MRTFSSLPEIAALSSQCNREARCSSALGEETVPAIRKAIVLNGRVVGRDPRRAVCVCACVYVRAHAQHSWCAGPVKLTGKCFLYVLSHARMSILSVSAVVCRYWVSFRSGTSDSEFKSVTEYITL